MSNKAKQLQDSVKRFILKEALIPRGSFVLTAVSGGQDSMALLSVLHALSTGLGFRLAAGHLDHKMRSSSREDWSTAGKFAETLRVPFYCDERDVLSFSEATGDSLEEAARKVRYRFLYDLAEEIGADLIATGHTRDDQIETVLMRILRGTGIRGLSGIPTKRGRLIRPLIEVGRKETLAYCRSQGIPFAKDVSNLDKRFFRNRIRHELIPFLRESFHPAVEDSIMRLSQNARELMTYIRARTTPIIQRNLKQVSGDEWILSLGELKNLEEPPLFVLFSDVFAEYLSCDMDFTTVHYRELARLCRARDTSGKMLSLPGLTVKREFDDLLINRNRPPGEKTKNTDLKVTLNLPGLTRTPGGTVELELLDRDNLEGRSLASSSEMAYISLDRLSPPLVLRRPHPGDRMRPFGMKGAKKLSDIFIDKKIPGRKREGALVISDTQEILWLVGVVTSESTRITEETIKILKVTVRRE